MGKFNRAFARLNREDQIVLSLFFVEELELFEMAHVLSLGLKEIALYLRRAIILLIVNLVEPGPA